VDRKFQFLFMKHFSWRLQFDYMHTHMLSATQKIFEDQPDRLAVLRNHSAPRSSFSISLRNFGVGLGLGEVCRELRRNSFFAAEPRARTDSRIHDARVDRCRASRI